jgi:hypothetical protein
MGLLTQALDPITFDVSNQANWKAEISDIDDDTGAEISHVGETLKMDIRRNDGELVVTATTSNYISIKPGTTHTIVIDIPWSLVKTYEGGEYRGTLVKVIDASNREVLYPIVFRQAEGETTSE